MSIHLDAGDILAQESLAIGPEETAGALEERLAPLGARMALDVTNQLAVGPVAGVPQDKSLATKAPKLTKEHGLVDWTRPALAVCNQVRAMHPWPTAYTFLHETDRPASRWLVHLVRPVIDKTLAGMQSGMLASDGGKMFVQTGAGAVEIVELQPAGKKKMPAGEFLRGHPLGAGARLA